MFIQLIKYSFVGVFATLIHILVASAYLYFMDAHLIFANVLGFCLAFIFSYTLQSVYVFEHALARTQLLKYLSVQLCALFLALVSSSYTPLENLYLKTLLICILLPLITFCIHKFWTFNTPKDGTLHARK